jgi:integrase/recombinase XerD
MLHLGANRARSKVNVLKKVKVGGQWKLCPVIVEAGGKLRDRVQVNGRPEVHNEGLYYIEWREDSQRRRQSISNRNLVLEHARLKALELDAKKAGIAVEPNGIARIVPPAPPSTATADAPVERAPIQIDSTISATSLIFRGVESYLQELIRASVRSQLQSLGITVNATEANAASFPILGLQTASAVQSAAAIRGKQEIHAGGKTPVADAIEGHLRDIKPPQREQKTYDEYRLVLYKFRDNCEKKYLQDITRDDCLSFMRHLYSIGNEARTVFNRMGIVEQLLRLHGITGLLKRRDKPKFVANVREMYQPEDLQALFKACDPDERVLYTFFLLTGERDKEVRYTTWDDIDFTRKCVRVTAKKHLGFKPKDKEERENPVPSLLLTALREYKARQTGPNPHHLVFPTSRGRPDTKFENKLKRIACRSGLNCGHCESRHGNRCSQGPHCQKWYLHKFRHTFATTSLEHGVSIRTLQEWLGHSDLESTMVYLKLVRRRDIHQVLDTSQMAGIAAESLGLKTAVHANKQFHPQGNCLNSEAPDSGS